MLVRLVGDKIDHAIRDHDVGRVVGDRQVLNLAEANSTFPVPILRALSRVTPAEEPRAARDTSRRPGGGERREVDLEEPAPVKRRA